MEYGMVYILHASSHVAEVAFAPYVPWAVRPVLPAYLLMGTASTWPLTFSRYARARVSFQPLMAWAVSRVFLYETRR